MFSTAAHSVDLMIKEYLIFRGFTLSLKHFEADLKGDKDKSFKVENILQQIQEFIHSYDISSLRNYWKYFEKRFFFRLGGHDVQRSIKKLESSVLRMYVVHALQTNRMDKVAEFFEKYAKELQHEESWREWFVIPFIKNPEQNKTFSVFFTRIWQESVILSLHNCFDTIFTEMSLPTLLNFEKEKIKIARLNEEIIKLKEQLAIYQRELIQFRSFQKLGKKQAMTQTSDLDITESDQFSKVTKSPASKARFGLKLLGFKDSKVIKKDLNNAKDNSNAKISKTHTSNDPKLRRLSASTKSASINNEDTSYERGVKQPSFGIGENKLLVQSTPVNVNLQELSEVTFVSANSDATSYLQSPDMCDDSQSSLSNRNYTGVTGEMPIDESEQSNFIDETLPKPFIVLSQEEFCDHLSPVVACKFSDDSTSVASLDLDGLVKIWHCYPTVTSAESVASRAGILSLDWVPKTENKIAFGKSNGKLALYDTTSNKNLWEDTVHPKYKRVGGVVCSPSGASLVCSVAAGPPDQPQRGVSSLMQRNIAQFESKSINMKSYTSYNESWDASREGGLYLWDLKAGSLLNELALEPYPVSVHCLSFNHNGTLLVTGGADGMIRLFDIRTNDCLVGWHAHSTDVLDVIFTPDETSIYSVGADGMLCVWDINQISSKIAEFVLPAGSNGINDPEISASLGLLQNQHTPCGTVLACDSEGQYLTTCALNSLMMYKVKPKTALDQAMLISGQNSEVLTLDWTSSPNCSTLICGTKSGAVQVSTLLKR